LGSNAVTGNWSYKIAKYGYELYSGTFLINKDISSVTNIAQTLLIDSSITITDVSTVSAYTDLNSTRKIYDYLSYYKTTSDGIDYGTFATRAIGSIILTKGLTLDNTASSIISIASDILTVKSSGLNEEITIYTSGDFTTNVNISDNVKIRATNIDSELELIGINKLSLYPTSGDRDSNTNVGIEITSTIYRFKYGSTISNVLLEDDMYSRVDVGSILLYNFTIESGNNILNLGTFGQIQQVLNNQITINEGVKKASRLIPHSTDL
jgi:LysM repeat protein